LRRSAAEKEEDDLQLPCPPITGRAIKHTKTNPSRHLSRVNPHSSLRTSHSNNRSQSLKTTITSRHPTRHSAPRISSPSPTRATAFPTPLAPADAPFSLFGLLLISQYAAGRRYLCTTIPRPVQLPLLLLDARKATTVDLKLHAAIAETARFHQSTAGCTGSSGVELGIPGPAVCPAVSGFWRPRLPTQTFELSAANS